MTNQPSPAAMRAAQRILVKFVTNTPSNPAFSQTRIGMAELIDREFEPVVEALRLIDQLERAYESGDPLMSCQGQGMDGYSLLANYREIGKKARQAISALEAK